MDFEVLKQISLILHFLIILSAFIFIIFYKWNRTVVSLVYRIYIAIFVWFGIVYIFNGCPATYFENFLSSKYLGQAFYPDYSFKDSTAKLFMQRWDIYVPLIVTLIWSLYSNPQSKSTRYVQFTLFYTYKGVSFPVKLIKKWIRKRIQARSQGL